MNNEIDYSEAVRALVNRWLGTREGQRVSRNIVAREMRGGIDRRKSPICRKWRSGNCLKMYGGSCEKTHKGCPFVALGDDATPEAVAAWVLGGLYPGLFSSTARRMQLSSGGIR